jgi:hypothetical protein
MQLASVRFVAARITAQARFANGILQPFTADGRRPAGIWIFCRKRICKRQCFGYKPHRSDGIAAPAGE